jgi:hypothetical protein
MPTYCYTNKASGETIKKIWSIAVMLKMEGDRDGISQGGDFYYRDYTTEYAKAPVGGCASWPMKSDAAGCNPSQCQEFSENSAKKGVPTSFDSKTGQAIFTSRSHRAKYMQSVGLHDNNGGYGDG